MTEEAQQIAIATVMKWPKMQNGVFWVSYPDKPGSGHDSRIIDDLNAMHEAEKTLSPVELEIYERRLHITSPAKDRAEEFLRTKYVWVE